MKIYKVEVACVAEGGVSREVYVVANNLGEVEEAVKVDGVLGPILNVPTSGFCNAIRRLEPITFYPDDIVLISPQVAITLLDKISL